MLLMMIDAEQVFFQDVLLIVNEQIAQLRHICQIRVVFGLGSEKFIFEFFEENQVLFALEAETVNL